MPFNKMLRGLLLIVLIGLPAGCAVRPAASPGLWPSPDGAPPAPEAGVGWRAVRFRMQRVGSDTRWEKDLLIAHRIIQPILATQSLDIRLWRFHRRSAGDAARHQFSFIYYTPAADAARIGRMVLADPLLKRLLADGEIAAVSVDPADRNDHPRLADTSDPAWSAVMQASWPFYIQGVSRMWLNMIAQISPTLPVDRDASMDQLLSHYRQVDAEITDTWQSEGRHALLHHLNAIFGYHLLRLRDGDYTRF